MEGFASSPILGTGFATVRDAHDIYLQLLQAGGILALLSFIVFVAGSLLTGLHLSRSASLSKPHRTLALALIASIVTWLVAGLAQNYVYDRYLYMPFALLLALAILAANVTVSNRPHEPQVRR